MRFNWRTASVLAVIVGAALVTVLVISIGRTSGDSESFRYEVTVSFNGAATEDDIEEVAAILRGYDADADFLVMEIFPPIGRALLTTDIPDFCGTVVAGLEAKAYVNDASCRLWVEPAGSDPDSPVSNDSGY